MSWESEDETILVGFLRLRLPVPEREVVFEELKGKVALLRELHIYGKTTEVGKACIKAQHRGLGTRLMQAAERIALSRGHTALAVIPGEGVKEYYLKRGFQRTPFYLVKPLVSSCILGKWPILFALFSFLLLGFFYIFSLLYIER